MGMAANQFKTLQAFSLQQLKGLPCNNILKYPPSFQPFAPYYAIIFLKKGVHEKMRRKDRKLKNLKLFWMCSNAAIRSGWAFSETATRMFSPFPSATHTTAKRSKFIFTAQRKA
jgi:hypothetical protein